MNKLEYSFDDELALRSSYDLENKKIELYFDRYYSPEKDENIDGLFVFKIADWKMAKGSINTLERKYDLYQCMGIIRIILFMEWKEDVLYMLVDTVDGRVLSLHFQEPILTLESSIEKT